jgi:multidrug efflux pump subunit AcrA (membrane-fusion protein)
MKYNFFVQNKKSKNILIVSVFVLVCLGIFGIYRLSVHNAVVSKKNVQTTVTVASVTRTDLIKTISLVGQTVPQAQVDIAAKYLGKINAVNVELGQAVTPGQILVVQDTGDADISIDQNKEAYQQASADAMTTVSTVNANYDKVKADYDKALASYRRNQQVFDVGGISLEDFETSQQTLADAKSNLDALENQMNGGVTASILSAQATAKKALVTIAASQKERDDLVLTAPRVGVIGYRQVEVGDIVSKGQKLLSIYDNRKLYVDCQVSEQDLAAFSVGTNVDVGVESIGQSIAGQVIYISPSVDTTNLTYTVRVLIDNEAGTLKSGMFTRSILNTVLRPNTLVISKDALLEKNGEQYVFVVDDKNAVHQRTVKIGARGDATVEILSGLDEGEQVATNNLSRLREGMTILPAGDEAGDSN